MDSAFLYPVALDVRGKRCVVVGAGPVGQRKAGALHEAGADVVTLSLETTGPFSETQLDGAFLVVAATDKPEVNEAVAQAARARGILLNLAAPGEETDGGDFATMASVRRGSLLVSVTTGGAGPALSARLKRQLQSELGPEWALFTALLAEVRVEAKKRIPDPAERARRLRTLAESTSILEKIRAGDLDSAMEEAASCLS
jgi:precorrin-2 dehydrogenase / sirohydrochlorin ferrochelatase